MNQPTPLQLVEAVLFAGGDEYTVRELADMLALEPATIEEVLIELDQALAGRGTSLVRSGDSVSLATSPVVAETLAQLRKEELASPLSKPSLETLAIILYKGPIAKSEIDFIRGVNSGFMLRNLMVRGLIQKIGGARGAYQATTELLRFFGVDRAIDLPAYQELTDELQKRASALQGDATEPGDNDLVS
jgi:segregation and condensation protein B